MTFMNLPIPNIWIDEASLVVLVIVVVGIAYRTRHGSLNHFFQWEVFNSPHVDEKKPNNQRSKPRVVGASLITILFHDVFATRVLSNCSKIKRYSHVSIFWGFVFLAVSTTLAFITNPNNVILSLYNPVKLFGNVGGALVVAGFIGMFYVRYREKQPVLRLNRSDMFLITLFLTVVTGFVTQQAVYSYAGPFWVPTTFWVHMVLVILLLATAPFTKFFHALSKPILLVYEEIDRKSGREPLLPSCDSINGQ